MSGIGSCGTCGEGLLEGRRFCAHCGTPVAEQGASPLLPAVVAHQPPPQVVYYPAYTQPPPKRKNATQGCASAIAGLILFGIGLLLLVFVTPLGLLYFGILVVVALVRVMTR